MSVSLSAEPIKPGPWGGVRHDWTRAEVRALFELPFPELIFEAQRIHRIHFDPREVQISTLLSIKTGGCPEDCAYCPQSVHYETGVKAEKLMRARRGAGGGACGQGRGRAALLHGRRLALAEGSRSRSSLQDGRGRESPRHGDLRHARHADGRAGRKAQASGPRLLQSQPRYLAGVLRRRSSRRASTRTGSTRWPPCARPAFMFAAAASSAWARRIEDRIGMIATLASLPEHPESVPINLLMQVEGTPVSLRAEDRSARFYSRHRRGADRHARLRRAAFRGARKHERGNPGALFSRGRQLDLLRPQAADDAEPRSKSRHAASRQARHAADVRLNKPQRKRHVRAACRHQGARTRARARRALGGTNPRRSRRRRDQGRARRRGRRDARLGPALRARQGRRKPFLRLLSRDQPQQALGRGRFPQERRRRRSCSRSRARRMC